ncbi:MAG: DUF5995 family protein [Ginsengibacter sp.]
MLLQTIDDVISTLTTIVKDCEQAKNRSGYFAALYKRMTIAVKDGMDKGAFMDADRMGKLDVVFASRYLNAYDAYNKNETCSTSWKYAFDGCINESLTVIQQLILGINTHINLDLAIASAVVAPGDSIHKLEVDFNRINDVIASLFDDVQQCLEDVWLPMKFLKKVGKTQQTNVLNFSVGAARKTAWANAIILAGMNQNQQQAYIQQMDSAVYHIAQKIIHPGFLESTLMKTIRMTEFDDVARTIKLIDTTVVN